jgi:hypothetical protein
MSMKSISNKLMSQIEYLRAVAVMYEAESNEVERLATLEAIKALKALVKVIERPTEAPYLPYAA